MIKLIIIKGVTKMYDLESLLSDSKDLVTSVSDKLTFVSNWMIVGGVVAILTAILVYSLFVNKKDNIKGFAGKFKDFLAFNDMYIEALLKMFYIGSTVYIIFLAVATAVVGDILGFFVQLLLGPVICRLAYEFAMVFVKLWKNSEKK